MKPDVMIFLIAGEAILLLFAVCIFLVLRNRILKRLIDRLKKRLKELMDSLKKTPEKNIAEPEPLAPEPLELEDTATISDDKKTYLEWVEDQINNTITFHKQLESTQDITQDITPSNALPNRTAALRNAILFAEKETLTQNTDEKPDWTILQRHYQHIFDSQKDPQDEDDDNKAINKAKNDAIKDELANARKRIDNLEKFKQLYFELEDKWQDCKSEAQKHFTELSQMADCADDTLAFEESLKRYHDAYNTISPLIESGLDDALASPLQEDMSTKFDRSAEIRRLKQVAVEQHQLIHELQQKLYENNAHENSDSIVSDLEEQLTKQERFLSEAETCVQLMEDELGVANTELNSLRPKIAGLLHIKAELLQTRKERDEFEFKLSALDTENRKLRKKVQESSGSSKDDAIESIKLRKTLTMMESKYNDLEEKFLDLKLQKSN